MRQHGPATITFEFAAKSWSEDNGPGQSDESADSMHHGGSGEVMETHAKRWEKVAFTAHQSQPSIRSPCPVSDDRINETGYADRVEQVPNESGTADHRARSDGRASVGKCELEDPHREERYPCAFIGRRRALQEEPVISDKPVTVCKHEGKSDGVEENAAKASVYHAFHQYIYGFAGTTEPSFQHGEADL